jgi:uncharacterized protein YdiU (UPF0061 family)
MNKNVKDVNTKYQKAVNNMKKAEQSYSYYSRILKEPFDSVEELIEAEEAYYTKLKAKEDKAAQKKADASLVEEAFTALNAARRTYKETLLKLTENYSAELVKLKEDFEAKKAEIQEVMTIAEDTYAQALKAFTEKYPEGYHLTLKDGDFETTISGSSNTSKAFDTNKAFQMIDWLFNL